MACNRQPAVLSNRFADAFAYTLSLHRHQCRKVQPVPYIAHLMGVAALVLEDGGSEDEAIAALLHDAVEDQGGEPIRIQIRHRYGEFILALVDACTESQSSLSRAGETTNSDT
ncbi:HD domain-containing protein [Sphaerothrix gracilis]|uniref:HD domain-containing protein n=1 Tax=Sphaerothrix gracilis TaxID=3151835 RepID=UPI0031FDE19C